MLPILFAASFASLDALKGLVPETEAPPPVAAVRELDAPDDAPPLAELLDPKFADSVRRNLRRSRREWQRRLKARGGRPSFAILSPLDPARELLVFVPGVGMHFQDAHAIVALEDTYQVAILVVDESRPIPEAGLEGAKAVEALVRRHGWAGRPFRLIGHSLGAPISLILLDELAKAGRLGEGGLFPKVLWVAIDGPWRGVDVPYPALAPGVRKVLAWLLTHLPVPKHPTAGTLSVLNRTPAMERLRGIELPPEVTSHLVTVRGPQKSLPWNRHYEPVANWFSEELGAGELKRLWQVLRERDPAWDRYDTWAVTGFARKQGLQNLQRALRRDTDAEGLEAELTRAARESRTPEEFRPRYDAIVAKVVDSFRGHHTHFMWEDPLFLPYIRERLAAW